MYISNCLPHAVVRGGASPVSRCRSMFPARHAVLPADADGPQELCRHAAC
jgi:hypothetical protein